MNNFEREQRAALNFLRGIYQNLADEARKRGNVDAQHLLIMRMSELGTQYGMLAMDRCESREAAKRKPPEHEEPEEKLDRLLGWANRELRNHFGDRLEAMRKNLSN